MRHFESTLTEHRDVIHWDGGTEMYFHRNELDTVNCNQIYIGL